MAFHCRVDDGAIFQKGSGHPDPTLYKKLLFFTQTEYLELADQLSAYVVKLLDKVRGHDELEIVINKTGRDSELETYERLSRFKLAIRYNEKKVSGFVVMVLHKVKGHNER